MDNRNERQDPLTPKVEKYASAGKCPKCGSNNTHEFLGLARCLDCGNDFAIPPNIEPNLR